MLKKFIYVVLLICNLNANNETPKSTQLEMFLFKIGFTSLVNDFENEKDFRNLNTADIKELKDNVKVILETMNQNIHTKDLLMEISKLKDELKQIKSEINYKSIEPKNATVVQTKKIYKKNITIDVKQANVRQAPFLSAKIVKVLTLNQSVNIEYCNEYGWCKLKDEEGYLAKFLLNGL